MILEPKIYGTLFCAIPIWTIENGFQFIDTSKYLSTGTNEKGNKTDVWTKLMNFLRFGKNKITKMPCQQGDWTVDSRIKLTGRVQYSWAKALGQFNGKGGAKRRVWSGSCFLEINSSGNVIVSDDYNLDFNKDVYGVKGANEPV